MAVKISGVLKDGTGKPVQNCAIQLKATRTSAAVVVHTVASDNPDEAGRYSMDVEYGQYSVILQVEGFPPSYAGIITVYEDSEPGTLNAFLGAMTEDDVRPEALRRFELMVEEVARNASAAAQNTAAAKKSASDAGTSASEAATHAADAAGSAHAAGTSAGQAASSAKDASSGAGTASAKATEAAKSAAAAEASESAAATSAGAAKTSERNAAASQQSAATSASTATTKASEAATSARDAAASKEAAKSSETNASSGASSAASSATSAGNSAKAAKTSETNARSAEAAAEQSASAAAGSETAAASSVRDASIKAGEAAGSATAAAQSKKAAESAATRAENAAGRAEDVAGGLENATLNQKGVVQLSNATDSLREDRAATSKAVSEAMENAEGRLSKEQNGRDIPDKAAFVRNVGAARAYGRDISLGAGDWTTEAFVTWLKAKGAFDQPYWVMKTSLPASLNKVITDTGLGKINLGGCAIEVIGSLSAAIVRVTIGEYGMTGFLNGTVCTCTVYGDTKYYHWRVDYTTKNKPTTASLAVNGWERDECTGRIRQWGKITISEEDGKLIRMYSLTFPVPFPGRALNVQVSPQESAPEHILGYSLSLPSQKSVTLLTVRGTYGSFYWEATGY